jgi:hypothetical protein
MALTKKTRGIAVVLLSMAFYISPIMAGKKERDERRRQAQQEE